MTAVHGHQRHSCWRGEVTQVYDGADRGYERARTVETDPVDSTSKTEILARLASWRDQDEPLVEAIGNTLADWQRVDSQEQARRVVDTIIGVLDREL